jgi:hypothetical protein
MHLSPFLRSNFIDNEMFSRKAEEEIEVINLDLELEGTIQLNCSIWSLSFNKNCN